MGGFDFTVILDNLPFLWKGMQMTLLLTALAVGAAFSLLHEASLSPIALIAAVVGLLAASSAWLPRDRAVG